MSDVSRIRSADRFQEHLRSGKALVVIPTYNERENIIPLVNAIHTLPVPFDLLVVDDGSPDGTADLIAQHATAWPHRTYLLRRSGKHGLGTAYRDAFGWVLTNLPEYTTIIQMDADFSHDPTVLPALLASAERYGVAAGSRYISGGSAPDWNVWRFLISRGGNLYARWILRMGSPSFAVQDATAGFTAYRTDVLRCILDWPIFGDGYAYQISMKYVAHQIGHPTVEIPIVFRDRTVGTSKIDRRIVREALVVPWRLLFFLNRPTDV